MYQQHGAAIYGRVRYAVVACCFQIAFAPPAAAHPHVFVDGGVGFIFDENQKLAALRVTWLFDEFETLYTLSSYGIGLNAEGALDERDRLELVRLRSDWPSDFDGSAHLTIAGKQIALDWPTDLDIDLIDGRLQSTFLRPLPEPVDLRGVPVEVAFYESTYFYAFSVTQAPEFLAGGQGCQAVVVPFTPDAQDAALQAVLAKLTREETPDNAQVGALFADRINVRCG